jgi:hypothetical protein
VDQKGNLSDASRDNAKEFLRGLGVGAIIAPLLLLVSLPTELAEIFLVYAVVITIIFIILIHLTPINFASTRLGLFDFLLGVIFPMNIVGIFVLLVDTM